MSNLLDVDEKIVTYKCKNKFPIFSKQTSDDPNINLSYTIMLKLNYTKVQ